MGNDPASRQVFNRLVRGAVLTQENAVMRENENRVGPHQRREAQRRPQVVRKDKEGGAVRNQSAQGHAIHNCAHAVFANAKVEVAPAEAAGLEVLFTFDQSVGGRRQVRRATEQGGQNG